MPWAEAQRVLLACSLSLEHLPAPMSCPRAWGWCGCTGQLHLIPLHSLARAVAVPQCWCPAALQPSAWHSLGKWVPLTLYLCAVWLGWLLPVCSRVLCGLWCLPWHMCAPEPPLFRAGEVVAWGNEVCLSWGKSQGQAVLMHCRAFIYTLHDVIHRPWLPWAWGG